MFPDYGGPVRLEDCSQHGPGSNAELLIVEGLSAAQAVIAVRDPLTQAVLPMQGKPMNAAKASKQLVLRNPLYQALMAAIGSQDTNCTSNSETPMRVQRYERLVILCDPDADGIHCGALLIIFLERFVKPELVAGRVVQIRPPAARVSWLDTLDKSHYALCPTLDHAAELIQQLQLAGYRSIRRQPYRGLAGIEQDILKQSCVAVETRNGATITEQDAQLALKYFGRS